MAKSNATTLSVGQRDKVVRRTTPVVRSATTME